MCGTTPIEVIRRQRVNELVFVMGKVDVFCEVQTEFLWLSVR